MGDVGLERGVHRDQPAVADLHSRGGQVQALGVAVPPDADQHLIDGELLSRAELEGELTGVSRNGRLVRGARYGALLPVEDDAVALHLRDQGPRDLAVEKRHQHVAAVNEMNFGPERGERAGVFAADGPRADHGHGPGEIDQVEQRIGVINSRAVRKHRGANGRRAGSDQDVLAADRQFSIVAGRVGLVLILGLALGYRPHVHRVRVHERCVSEEDLGVEGIELLGEHRIQAALDRALMPQEVADGCLPADREVHAVEISGPQSGQGHGRLAECLAGHRPRVGPRAAELMVPVDQRHGLAQDAGRRHPVEAGGTTADDDQIIRLWLVTHRDPRQSSWVSRIACKEYSRPRRPSVSPNAVELAIILFVEGIWGSLSPRNFARPVLFSCSWSCFGFSGSLARARRAGRTAGPGTCFFLCSWTITSLVLYLRAANAYVDELHFMP